MGIKEGIDRGRYTVGEKGGGTARILVGGEKRSKDIPGLVLLKGEGEKRARRIL